MTYIDVTFRGSAVCMKNVMSAIGKYLNNNRLLIELTSMLDEELISNQ
jgi:hypothetical protein